MSLAWLQDIRLIYKTQLYVCILTLQDQKLKLKNNAIRNAQNYQNLRNNFDKCERPVEKKL